MATMYKVFISFYVERRLRNYLSVKPGFHLDFFVFCCSFWSFVPTKNQKEQCDVQIGTSTKNQNEQLKAKTSNQRHLPVLVFEIELILSQKQERTTKSSKKQRTANGNTPKNPKRATKRIFHSIFIHLLQL